MPRRPWLPEATVPAQSIIVADDSPQNRDLLTDALRAFGFDPVPVNDGLEAVERARAGDVALILMDVSMPVMDGIEATRELAADARTSAIPVWYVSAHTGESAQRTALAAGGERYITKPVRVRELITDLRNRLEHLPSAAG
jgi:two-component system, cell cycle response regulator DivK